MRGRHLIAVGGCVAALMLAWLIDVLYVSVVSDDYRELLANRVEREAGVLDEMTLNSKAMGAVLLAGQLNNEIRSAALQATEPRIGKEGIAHDALRVVARNVGANHAFVVNAEGVITGDWDGEGRPSVIGQDVRARPYFRQAMAGVENVSLLVSQSTGKRMLYVAAPVYRIRGRKDDVIGAVVARFDIEFIDRFLAHWQMTQAALVSPDGVVMSASKVDWVLQLEGAADESRRARLDASARYGNTFASRVALKSLPDLSATDVTLNGRHFVVMRTPVDWNDPDGKWILVLLGDVSQVAPLQRRIALMGSTFAVALLILWLTLRALHDLEIRRQAARELRASEKRLQSMIRNIPGVVFRCRAEAPWTMLFVSDDVETLTGFPAADFVGNPPRRRLIDLVHPDDVSVMVGAMKSAIVEHRQYIGEVRLINHLGQIRWVYGRGLATYEETGHARFFDGVLFDFNDRKQAETAMLEARKIAEDATRTKSEFLANMSHEIRTPMNAIIGMSHLVMQTTLDSRQRSYVAKIDKAANNLLGIINDILDFSKLEAGKLEIEKIPFDLESVFENLASLVGIRAEEKQLELLFDLPPEVPAKLVGDPLRLEQILLNLVNNAVKFTDRGEIVVRVTAGDSASTTCGEGRILHFSVRDSGIGMSADQCQRLFQSFSQADASTTRKYGGTGLGLAISRTLVELMGGRIWVQSEPGEGSVFHFSVPFAVPHAEVSNRHARDKLTGIRVLVVANNEMVRAVLENAVANLGCIVEAVAGGSSALSRVTNAEREGAPFSVVLMDWYMPGMDGLACLQAMAQLPLTKQPATIIVTSFNREELLNVAEMQGFSLPQLLSKPVMPEKLYTSICSVLGMHEADVLPGHLEIESSARSRLSGARLLLVEDNDMNRDLATELLEQAGVSLICAENGQQAVDILAADDDFDGVLMDCQMPIMDGYETTRVIRDNPLWCNLPVIAMTANALVGDRERALAAGMNDHIAKPLQIGAMFDTLAQWIKPKERAERSVTSGMKLLSRASKAALLPKINTLDLVSGLQVADGNHDLYLRMLERFVNSQSDMSTRFTEALAAGDRKTATRIAHTLKGNAGNIGAHEVQVAAAQLELLCLSEGDDKKLLVHLGNVHKALAPLLHSLRAELRIPSPLPAFLAADSNRLMKMTLHLQALLRDSDAEAIELGGEISASLGDITLEKAFRSVTQALEICDFDGALVELGSFIAQLDKQPGGTDCV